MLLSYKRILGLLMFESSFLALSSKLSLMHLKTSFLIFSFFKIAFEHSGLISWTQLLLKVHQYSPNLSVLPCLASSVSAHIFLIVYINMTSPDRSMSLELFMQYLPPDRQFSLAIVNPLSSQEVQCSIV